MTIRQKIDAALDNIGNDVKVLIDESREDISSAIMKQVYIKERERSNSAYTYNISIGAKIDLETRKVDTSISWTVREKRNAESYIDSNQPGLFDNLKEGESVTIDGVKIERKK